MIVYVNGRGMNAPELKAYISELEAENAELRAKVESAERQIAEYDDELRKAKRLLGEALRTLNDGSCNKDCRQCKWNENGCEMSCRFAWRYGDEVSALIGDENDAE